MEWPYGSTAFVDLGSFFSFLIYTKSVRPFDGGWVRRKAATHTTHRTTQTQTKPAQTTMPRMGFEPTIPVLELAKPRGHCNRQKIMNGIWNEVNWKGRPNTLCDGTGKTRNNLQWGQTLSCNRFRSPQWEEVTVAKPSGRSMKGEIWRWRAETTFHSATSRTQARIFQSPQLQAMAWMTGIQYAMPPSSDRLRRIVAHSSRYSRNI
jgi:hypothetical protein